jgi:hypothetical protein
VREKTLRIELLRLINVDWDIISFPAFGYPSDRNGAQRDFFIKGGAKMDTNRKILNMEGD